jgi:peptidoglycan/LPS O-acetylase OafA/YrhL
MFAAIATSMLFVRNFPNYSPITHNRFLVLDGLRGYLAIGVFIHHSSIWYFNLRGRNWKAPDSHFYNNLGQAGVALFFMITAFLFFSKLLDAKNKRIDWYRLYISRILRIFPLYIFASLVIFLIVFLITDFTLSQSVADLTKNIFKFLQFKIPNINNADVGLITAGVIWTLRWERSFYITLPFFAFFLGLNVSRVWLAIIAVFTVGTIIGDKEAISLCFVGGIVASFIIKNNFHLEFFRKPLFGIFAILCLVFEVLYFKTSFQPLALVLLSVFFIAAVADNVLFKVFSFKASQFLSTISYSIYLLHGIILFVMFKFVIGFEVARDFSVIQYWCVICCAAVILVLISSLSYRFIELPFLNLAKSKNFNRPNFIRFLSFSKFSK